MPELKSYLGWQVDFAAPKGEPALVGPDSIQWRVFKNPIALAIGGVAAVLLEFADARIRSGVWDHSVFKQDPIGRSRRTGMAAMVGVYGPASAARRVIAGVTNMHAKVSGETPKGEAYRALDPDLLAWVSATAGFGFLTAYDRFVARLTAADKQRFFDEGAPIARLYGVTEPLRSLAHFDEMMTGLVPRFEPHPIVTEFLAIIKSGKAAPGVPRSLHSALANASVAILPPVVRDKLELGKEYTLSPLAERGLAAAGWLADRIPLKATPAAQASLRLGLPYDFPWRREAAKTRLLAATPYARTAQATA